MHRKEVAIITIRFHIGKLKSIELKDGIDHAVCTEEKIKPDPYCVVL